MIREYKRCCMKILTAFFAVLSLLGGIAGKDIQVEADVAYDINWNMDKEGVYLDIPDMVKDSFGNPESWIKSGDYSYEFLDSDKKYITVRNVENVGETLTIPEEIDGCKVIGVGCWGLSAGRIEDAGEWQGGRMSGEFSDGSICAQSDVPKKIVLPEGLEFVGTGAFYSKGLDPNLYSVHFPESLVYIGSYAFSNRAALKEISIPSGVYVDVQAFSDMNNWERVELFSDCRIQDDNFIGDKNTVIIRKHEENDFNVPVSLSDKTKHFYIKGALECVSFELDKEEVEDVYGNLLPRTAYVERVYVNNTKTKLSVNTAVTIENLYTVPKASAIQYAKKSNTDYTIKVPGKKREVTGKKLSRKKTYQAKWKGIKTTACKYLFDMNKDKWKIKKSPVKTVYRIYGKKSKGGSYRFIKTSKQKKIQSKYKYIKVIPSKEWE